MLWKCPISAKDLEFSTTIICSRAERHYPYSCFQIQNYGNLIFNEAIQLRGYTNVDQRDEYRIFICFRHVIPYIKQIYPNDDEMITLPQITTTQEGTWNPKYDDDLSMDVFIQKIPTTHMNVGKIIKFNQSEGHVS